MGRLGPWGLSALATALSILLLLLWISIESSRERERRAARRALSLGLLLPLPYVVTAWLALEGHETPAILLLCATAAGLLFSLLPYRLGPLIDDDTPMTRPDERDTMFSRYRLVPGSGRFDAYYRRHPEKKRLDDPFRARPGLLRHGAAHYDRFQFAAARASFTTVDQFESIVAGRASEEVVPIDPEAMTRFVLGWGLKLGAVSVGIAEMKDYHYYTYVGRGKDYGRPIEPCHRFGIAITVEMDKDAVDHAPFGPTVMESAQQYLASGAIAVQIAEFIRNLGYPARAHIDAHYHVVCPLVARDAGLGEIGRMGLLMTPELGPRVRIAVITTDLPLLPHRRVHDPTVIDFCERCRKCADACPSRAIPSGDRTRIDGVPRWRIDSEACFTFWCTVGTDCARCIRVCPYSHPSNAMHGLVRRAIRRSPTLRWIAIKGDDFLYGKVPPSRKPTGWLRYGKQK